MSVFAMGAEMTFMDEGNAGNEGSNWQWELDGLIHVISLIYILQKRSKLYCKTLPRISINIDVSAMSFPANWQESPIWVTNE